MANPVHSMEMYFITHVYIVGDCLPEFRPINHKSLANKFKTRSYYRKESAADILNEPRVIISCYHSVMHTNVRFFGLRFSVPNL